MTDLLLAILFLVAMALMVVCVAKERAGYLNHRAGSVSRMWIAKTVAGIVADRDSSAEAKILAEEFLTYAYNPMPRSKLDEMKEEYDPVEKEEVLSKYKAKLGHHFYVMQDVAHHSAILTALNDRALANPMRKIVEGSLDIEINANGVARDTIASDLAVNFGRLDHNRASASVVRAMDRNRHLEAA